MFCLASQQPSNNMECDFEIKMSNEWTGFFRQPQHFCFLQIIWPTLKFLDLTPLIMTCSHCIGLHCLLATADILLYHRQPSYDILQVPLPSLQQILVAGLKSGWKTEFILCCVGYPIFCHFLWRCHSRNIRKSISVFVLMYLDDEFKLYMITQQWIVAVGTTTPPRRWNINILFWS